MVDWAGPIEAIRSADAAQQFAGPGKSGKTPGTRIDCERAQEACLVKGAIVKLSRFIKRLVAGDNALRGGGALGRLIGWLFIALVALFLTQPSGGPFSAAGMQVPWPAELGLEGGLPGR
jgi:hypothetical protein